MKRVFKKRSLIGLIAALAVLGAIYYSTRGGHRADAQMPPGQQGPMPVKVEIVQKKPLRLWTSFPGHLTAVDYVELRPQVSGRIEKIKFEDGQDVKKGDILFVIDPRPYQASVEEAKAALAGAKNRHALALSEFERAQSLIKAQAISQRILDERRNASLVAGNDLQSAQAALARAQVDLDHAYIKAPIAGRISRAEITEGNLVQAGPGAPVLTTIVSSEGIYADFQVDEQTYLKSIRRGGQGENAEIPVQLVLEGEDRIYEGSLRSFDNRIDPSSGTIRARAHFGNGDGALLPGMFATVKIASPVEEEAILLTEQAVGTDQDRKFVYVVDDKNKVAYREVALGASTEGGRVIAKGLQPGEKVIVEGLMKVRPEMPVSPQMAEKADNRPPEELLPPPQE